MPRKFQSMKEFLKDKFGGNVVAVRQRGLDKYPVVYKAPGHKFGLAPRYIPVKHRADAPTILRKYLRQANVLRGRRPDGKKKLRVRKPTPKVMDVTQQVLAMAVLRQAGLVPKKKAPAKKAAAKKDPYFDGYKFKVLAKPNHIIMKDVVVKPNHMINKKKPAAKKKAPVANKVVQGNVVGGPLNLMEGFKNGSSLSISDHAYIEAAMNMAEKQPMPKKRAPAKKKAQAPKAKPANKKGKPAAANKKANAAKKRIAPIPVNKKANAIENLNNNSNMAKKANKIAVEAVNNAVNAKILAKAAPSKKHKDLANKANKVANDAINLANNLNSNNKTFNSKNNLMSSNGSNNSSNGSNNNRSSNGSNNNGSSKGSNNSGTGKR